MLDVDVTAVRASWWRHVPAGADVLYKPARPRDNRWQRGSVIDALYVSDDPATVWAEWYRTVARLAIPPVEALPADLWRLRLDLDPVADLSDAARLTRVGLPVPRLGSNDWSAFQRVGEALYEEGFKGVVAPTDARPGWLVACIFRPGLELAGVTPEPPSVRVTNPPLVPIGMAT